MKKIYLALIILVAAIEVTIAQTPFVPPGPPIATGKPKFLGCAHSVPQKVYFNKYWNQVTPENAGKWGSVEATRDVMNWSELDSAYKMAKDNGFIFKMHVLIWGSQQPMWIETLPPAEQLMEIKQWFAAVAQRYPAIDIIEVVNEPLHTPPSGTGTGNYINALGGTGTTGYDWIVTSYQLARQYFPTSKLWLTDYSIINDNAKTAQFLTIINLLKAQNLLDGVGEQAHAFTTSGIAATTLTNNLNMLASAGLPLYATELDIDGPGAAEVNGIHVTNPVADSIQLAEYKRVFPLFWEHPAIKGVTLWGYRVGHWRTNQGAYIAYSDGTERPALVWLRNYVQTTNIILPVSLTLFEATKNNNTVKISWSVENEINNDHYVIERSVDGLNYTTLLNVKANTSGLQKKDYSVEDVNPLNGKNYYRLVQYDKDGTKTFCGVKTVIFSKSGQLYVQVYPSPATTSFTIRTVPEVKSITITNLSGRIIKRVIMSSTSMQTISTNDFSDGVYFINGKTKEASVTTRIVIVKNP